MKKFALGAECIVGSFPQWSTVIHSFERRTLSVLMRKFPCKSCTPVPFVRFRRPSLSVLSSSASPRSSSSYS